MYMKKENSNIGVVIAGLMLAIIISAMDNTIVSTAMGNIISELGGMDKFIWVSAAYLIACVAGMPIYGKLSDMYGRKFFFITGLILFITGSALCGFSKTMQQLIIFRVIQGIGGGAIMPIAFTILFDITPLEQRGKLSGLFGAAFGVSSLFGPLLGSFLSEYASWRWAFFINFPIGILSIIFLTLFYHESKNHTKQKIDWAGAVLLVSSIICLMLALEMGGKVYGWASVQIISMFVLFAICMIAFLFIESKVSDPILPLDLFKVRLFICSQLTAFLYGTVFIIAIMYIPIYIQGVFGGSATNSGLILMPMMLASVVGSQIGGSLTLKLTYRNIMLGSVVLLMSGFAFLGSLTVDSSRWMVVAYMIITGIGVGISFSVLTITSTDGIAFNRMGSANSSVTFFRSVGMTIGVTVFGTIQNNIMQGRFVKDIPSFAGLEQKLDARALLQPQVRQHIPPEILEKMMGILAGSITQVFWLTLVSLTIALFFIIIMGSKKYAIPQQIKSFKEGILFDVNENGGARNFNGGEESPL